MVVRGQSAEIGNGITGEQFDMVFIDAEHTYEGCKADLEAWAPKARKIVAVHDYTASWPGVMQAFNEMYEVARIKTCGTIAYVEV